MTPLAAQMILISTGVLSVVLSLISVTALLSLARIHRLRRQTVVVPESQEGQTASPAPDRVRQPVAVRQVVQASDHMRRAPALHNAQARRLLAFLKAELIYAEKPT